MNKRLYKSRDKKLAGVCAGLAEYFDIDPTVVRLAFILLSICSAAFPGILIYVICMLIMPEA